MGTDVTDEHEKYPWQSVVSPQRARGSARMVMVLRSNPPQPAQAGFAFHATLALKTAAIPWIATVAVITH